MTLVELLAVCAIIGILAAMALPALSRAIARSRLTLCTNNQYQVAFALLRYDEQYGSVPGWLNQLPLPAASGTVACSWTIPLLPFLGRNDVYDMILDRANVATGLNLPNESRVEVFICPANRAARTVTYPTHYTGNVGASGTNANDGVFLNVFRGSPAISLGDIADADGSATTLAFAEKASFAFDPQAWTYSTTGAAAPVVAAFGAGTAVPPVFGVSGVPPSGPPVINKASFLGFAPSSVHPVGAVVAFCDGHTGFLSDALQPYEYGQLLTPKSRWSGVTNMTNSAAMQPWLLRSGQPYLLDEKILRP